MGLEQAKGDWVLFIDSDDYIEPDTLQQYSQAINSNDTYYIQDYYIDTPSLQWKIEFKRRKRAVPILDAMSVLAARYHNSIGYIWHCLFNREIIEAHGLRFEENLSFGEDSVFAFQYLSFMNKGIFIPYKGYHYCDANPKSLTKTIKVSPAQYHFMITRILSATSAKLEAAKGNDYDTMKYYLANLILRGITALEKQDLNTRTSYYQKYGETLNLCPSIYQGTHFSPLFTRIIREGYSETLAIQLNQQRKNLKVQKHVLCQRILDKIYNLFR